MIMPGQTVNLVIFSGNGMFMAEKANLVFAASLCCDASIVGDQLFTARNASVDG